MSAFKANSFLLLLYFWQLLFVITDSGQAPDQRPSTPLDQASLPLKNKGVQIYGLGIGDRVPEQNLRDIASRPQNVFRPVNSVDDLPQRRPTVVDTWRTYLRGKIKSRLSISLYSLLLFLVQRHQVKNYLVKRATYSNKMPLKKRRRKRATVLTQFTHRVYFRTFAQADVLSQLEMWPGLYWVLLYID